MSTGEATGPPASVPEVDKSAQAIRDMFAGVAPRYDLLNRLLTGWLDVVWRRRSARALRLGAGTRVLDLCSGTGDQAVAVGRHGPAVAAADFCLPMVALSRRKFASSGGGPGPYPLVADAQRLPFEAGAFDGVTVSFGVRNVEDLDEGLAQIAGALRPGGRVAILELAVPRLAWLRGIYLFYFLKVLPRIGRLLSPRGSAYSYLPDSVLSFPQRGDFAERLERAGLVDAAWVDFAAGAVCLYTARRPTEPPGTSDDKARLRAGEPGEDRK